jgi:hypothetical protein
MKKRIIRVQKIQQKNKKYLIINSDKITGERLGSGSSP